jgi:hypothetical protein
MICAKPLDSSALIKAHLAEHFSQAGLRKGLLFEIA